MDRETVIQLAFEAGLYYFPKGTCCMDEMFPRHFNLIEADEAYMKFATLVAQTEREECAKIAEEVGTRDRNTHAWDAADAIRARGEK